MTGFAPVKVTPTKASPLKVPPGRVSPGHGNFPGRARVQRAMQQTSEGAIQRQHTITSAQGRSGPEVNDPEAIKKLLRTNEMWAFQKGIQESIRKDKLRDPIVNELADKYFNRPGKWEGIEPFTLYDEYGRIVWEFPGATGPSIWDVRWAIYNAMDFTEIDKGKKFTEFKWHDPVSKNKTGGQKVKEVGEFAAENFITGKIREEAIEFSVTWLAKRGLLATASLLTGAGEIYAVASLVYGLYELVESLIEPAGLTEKQQFNADIVADVKRWLQPEEAVDYMKRPPEPQDNLPSPLPPANLK